MKKIVDTSVFGFDEKQLGYIYLVSQVMQARAIGDVPLAFIHTYGCQQNISDSEKLQGMLELMGYEFTDDKEKADLIIFNTCAIREHAEDRVFGNVGALKILKKRKPTLLIALCGCMMEQKHIVERIQKSYPFVGLVFGTNCFHKFPELMYNSLSGCKRVVQIGLADKTIQEGIPVKRDKTFKGWLPVMYGCDNYCSYCIVPYVRGRERSRKPQDIIDEARDMIEAGYKDITLLGQNVNSYGKGLEKEITFAQLLQEIDKIEGDYWLRFMTSHPKDCTKELIDTIANSKHISSHIHLPFQSGSDKVLKIMNRKYDIEKYLNTVRYAYEKIEDLSLTSDIIIGFPGETYEDYLETVNVVKEVQFTSLFIFIYSPRVGTPAEKFDDIIAYEQKSKWFTELLNLQGEISASKCEKMVGKTLKVLVENETNDGERLSGKTASNITVEFKGNKNLIGSFANVKITVARKFILLGELV